MKKIIGVLLTSLSFFTLSSCNKTNEATTSTTNTTTTDVISSYQEYDNPFNMIGIGGFGYAGSFEILGPIEGSDVGENLIIPNKITKDGEIIGSVVAIGPDAFKNFAIKNLVLPTTLKFIYQGAFENCHNLENIKFMDDDGNITRQFNIKSIDENAFKNAGIKYTNGLFINSNGDLLAADSNIEELTLPDDVNSIYGGVFKNSKLKKIDLNNATTIYDDSFTGSKLEEISGGDKIKYITYYAYNNTPFFRSLNSKYVLGEVLLYDNITDSNYIIDKNVKSIAYLYGNSSSIVIPKNIENIYVHALNDISNLENIYFENIYGNTSISSYNGLDNVNLIVPFGALNYYITNNRSLESNFKTKEISISFYKGDTFIKTETFNYGENLRIPNDYISVKDSDGNIYRRGDTLYFHDDTTLYLYESSMTLE